MEINYWAILVCAVVSMVLGAIWYGAVFGKKWMEINGVDQTDPEKLKKMQKTAGPLYLVQFLLTLFQVYVLSHYLGGWPGISGICNALWIWAGFIIPTLAGAVMWTNESSSNKWSKFLIQTGYQLLLFVVFALILSYWI